VSFPDLYSHILQEMDAVLSRVDSAQVDALVQALLAARRVYVYGAGRGGLILRGWAMRLMHAGLSAAVVGEMTTPPIGRGDLLVVNSAKGAGITTAAIARAGRDLGATLAVITAQPQGPIPSLAQLVLVIPAATMADAEGTRSIQPMGAVYEQSLWVLGDLLVAQVQAARGVTTATMRARHTNLE
jgi:6-phospho-3-hexuloisomerase